MVDKRFYNYVLSQVFSPCGNLLVCGNIYGDLAIFDLKKILKKEREDNLPKLLFSLPQQAQICSLASSGKFLIAGSVGAIFGWDWNSIKSLKPHLAWAIQIPSSNNEKPDVNSMFVGKAEHSNHLIAGCGDNIIYKFSLEEDGKLIRKFSGHTDCIHSVSNFEHQMASASEDGTVRIWDLRQSIATSSLWPSTIPELARPHLGKWIGDVDISQNWLVCGGGPCLSLWHMSSLKMMTKFEGLTDKGIHISKLYKGYILAGGKDRNFYQLSYFGNVLFKLQTSASSIYSAVNTTTPSLVFSLAGASKEINICTNFTYRHRMLKFFP